jgi:ATP-dependent helicase HepA
MRRRVAEVPLANTDIKLGMYVRCPIEDEYTNEPRRFALGQVIEINVFYGEVKVRFYVPEKKSDLYEIYNLPPVEKYLIEQVKKVRILPNTDVLLKSSDKNARLISFSHTDENGFHHYYIQHKVNGKNVIRLESEAEIIAFFTRGDSDVKDQILSYELHNPNWYLHRQVVADSIHSLKNATFGFETLIGSRVFLLPHQVDTIVRAITNTPCRYMLADEVGLGKTIEASVIMKGLQKRLGSLRILLVVPQSLVYQWRNELSYKFWTDFSVYKTEDCLESEKAIIFPLEKLNTAQGRKVLSLHWDLCLIDETHRLLRREEEYKQIFMLSKRVEHILLLSATPIQSRHEEFLKLAALLDPQKYGEMSKERFKFLLEKQDYLRKKVYRMMRDLPDYIEDELAEEYVEELEEIADRLADPILHGIVNQINPDSEDQGLDQVKLALAYIAEHYQIERKIIRHRRKELSDKLPKRVFDFMSYEMRGGDENFYEVEVYDSLLEYLHYINQQVINGGDYAKYFLSAMFSSPYALLNVIQNREKMIESKCVPISSPFVPIQDGEREYLQTIRFYAERWHRATEQEFTQINRLYDDPDLIKGRLMKAIDYISAYTVDEKLVIFSSWTETIRAFEKILKEQYGSNAVVSFYDGKSDQELQEAVDRFQREATCRFMLCDSLGGEGRNFQMADQILHLDLPWSPTDLEQRIGRLDRIGREKEVRSIVFCTEQTLEHDLFNIWDQGLHIFRESLSGVEIAIGEIQEEIVQALYKDVRYELRNILPKMQKQLDKMRAVVEEERYFDMARQLDKHVQEQLMRLIQKFERENGQQLAETMLEWSSMTGLGSSSAEKGKVVVFRPEQTSINSMKKTLFIPPDLVEARRRAKRTGEVRGTFNRSIAVNREDLIFYAPGDPFFEAIVNNAYEMDSGRSTAFTICRAELNWEGFIFTWSVALNPNYLLALKEPLESIALAQGYLPLEHIYTTESLQEDDVDDQTVLSWLNPHISKSRIVHLGKRGNGSITCFKKQYPPEYWKSIFEQAYEQSEQKVYERLKNEIDLKRATNDFQTMLSAQKAALIYYGSHEKHSQSESRMRRMYEALLQGLKDPIVRLESVAFVRLVIE